MSEREKQKLFDDNLNTLFFFLLFVLMVEIRLLRGEGYNLKIT